MPKSKKEKIVKKSVPRKLTKEEITHITSYLVPNPNIPKEIAKEICEQEITRQTKQLENIEIYPKLIPHLKSSLVKTYLASQMQAGECVGILTAQSIGEKQTQANLNSVDWAEKIMYCNSSQIFVEPIGKIIDSLLAQNKDKIQLIPENRTEYLDTENIGLKIPSCDEDGNCDWYKIEGITRHLPVGNLVYIKTRSGRSVVVTKSKSLIVWDGTKFCPKNGSDVQIGDILPTAKVLLKPVENKTLSMRTILQPDKFVYTSEIIKARHKIYDWGKRNGDEFILPYKRRDTCFGKRKEYYMTCLSGYIGYMSSKTPSIFPEDMPLDEDFGFFVGIYLAEGLSTNTYVCITNNTEEILDRVRKFCDKYSIKYHIVNNVFYNGTSTDIRIHSVILAKVMKYLCNTGSQYKKIPDIAYSAPNNFIVNLIDGYFSGDGTVNKNTGYILANSASKELITGISVLLSYFGIYTQLTGVQPKEKNGKQFLYSNILIIRNGFAHIFAEKIKLTEPNKQDRLNNITKKKKYIYTFDKCQENLPLRDVYFDSIVEIKEVVKGTCEYVYDLTVEKTRNFQLWNGLIVRDTFHRAGSSDKQPVTSKFAELLNATKEPKAPMCITYFKHGNTTIPELRETIGSSLVQLTFRKITKDYKVCLNKESEPWYEAFKIARDIEEIPYRDCISLILDMDILFTYRVSLEDISKYLMSNYVDMLCVYSPDCIGKLDIFVDTSEISLPDSVDTLHTSEEIREIYIDDDVYPTLMDMVICGIPGVENMFFIKDGNNWGLELENTRTKLQDAITRYKRILAHPAVDMSRTTTNNVWVIYHTLGVEAAREYMIREFSSIMEGINTCHVTLLVDKMTHGGTIASISRYTMRQDESGPFGKASFEETLDNFLAAGVFAQVEPTRGVSASIICGKKAGIGTGLCHLKMNLSKLKPRLKSIKENEQAEQNE